MWLQYNINLQMYIAHFCLFYDKKTTNNNNNNTNNNKCKISKLSYNSYYKYNTNSIGINYLF